MGPFPTHQPQQPNLPPPNRSASVSSSPIWKRQTLIQPVVQQVPGNLTPVPGTPTPALPPISLTTLTTTGEPASSSPAIALRPRSRIVAIILICLLAGALYFVWHSPTTTPAGGTSIIQQNFSSSSQGTTSGGSSTSGTGTIQVYIVGAVKHPGVYTLAVGARVHDLLIAAGGPLPQANLVALNLVAKLSDGQEVYVTVQGEIPPSYVGGVPGTGTGAGNTGNTSCVNINTATADDMRQNLHVSSTTAQSIINHRLQQGNYTSVEQLSSVVSKTIYDKIKGLVCVS